MSPSLPGISPMRNSWVVYILRRNKESSVNTATSVCDTCPVDLKLVTIWTSTGTDSGMHFTINVLKYIHLETILRHSFLQQ